MKERIKTFLNMFGAMAVVSFVIFLLSRKYQIALVWILSPFWMLFALLIAALLISIIKVPFETVYFYFKKGHRNESSDSSKTDGSQI